MDSTVSSSSPRVIRFCIPAQKVFGNARLHGISLRDTDGAGGPAWTAGGQQFIAIGSTPVHMH